MSFADQYDLEFLANEAERIVLEKLESELDLPENQSVCRCQDCVLDMAAYALNHVKPLYRASLTGRLYVTAYEEGEYAETVERAVRSALTHIAENPSHD